MLLIIWNINEIKQLIIKSDDNKIFFTKCTNNQLDIERLLENCTYFFNIS